MTKAEDVILLEEGGADINSQEHHHLRVTFALISSPVWSTIHKQFIQK